MCELTAFLQRDLVYRNVAYAKNEEQGVLLRNALGAEKKIKYCRIIEVDMISKRLVLSTTQRT